MKANEGNERDHQARHAHDGEAHTSNLKDRPHIIGGNAPNVGGPQALGHVLQDQAQPKPDQEGVPDLVLCRELYHADKEHSVQNEPDQEQKDDGQGNTREGVHPQQVKEPKAGVAAKHQEFPVGYV